MPKGETSRPYNRKEKKAVKEQKAIKKGLVGKSAANKTTILKGKRNIKSRDTLTNREIKANARKFGKQKERTEGKSLSSSYKISRDKKGKATAKMTKRK